MNSETVLVTGGQGFLGQHIIRLLQKDARVKEIRVVDVEEFTNRIGFEENKELKAFVGDVTKPDTFNEVFVGVDCVIHVAGKTGFAQFPSAKEMEEVNVNGTRNVIHQCIKDNVKRLVFTSTSHVAVPRTDALVLAAEHTAQCPPPGGFLFGHYGRTKLEAENLVREANGKRLANGVGKLVTICLRPTLLYGELDPYYVTHALKVANKHGGRLYRVGWGGERSQVTYAGNAAWAHIVAKNQLADDPSLVGGEAVFITDDTTIENPFVFLEPFLKARSMRLSSIQFPAYLAIIFVIFLYAFTRLIRPVMRIRNPFPHPATLYYVVCLYCFNRLKATLRLGYKPIYDHQESIGNSLAYYKHVPLS